MFEKNHQLAGALLLSVGLLFGFGVGYAVKTTPEPKIEVRALLKAPWLEVSVNGKPVDLTRIKFGPETEKKRWWGDEAGATASLLFGSGCDCGNSCFCDPCHCHAAKPITFATQAEQRGGEKKSPELLGIESLVSILKDLKEAIFGKNGQPGLRDDIANGLKDFYASLRTGVIVAGGTLAAFMLWVAVSLQRIADNSATRVQQMTALQSIARAGG